MTFRVTFGIDPGQTGAISIWRDDECEWLADMPTCPRTIGEGLEIDGAALALLLRTEYRKCSGASVSACIEHVNAMRSPGAEGERRAMGTSSAFRFGEGFGKVKGVLEALGIPYTAVVPATWKRRFELLRQEKDASRIAAIDRAPHLDEYLKRKKDGGRADAFFIGLYGVLTEA